MRMICLLAAMAVTAPALAEPDPACETAANRLMDFILEELPDNEAGAVLADRLSREGRQAMIDKAAADLTDEQCAFLMVAPDSTVQAIAKTITAD